MRGGFAAALIFALGCAVASPVRSDQWTPEIRPYGGPSYFASAYSSDQDYVDNADSPNARARIGFMTPITRQYQVIGPVLFRPEIQFEWMARRWPIGRDSSPIAENNEYMPGAGFSIALDDSLWDGNLPWPLDFEGLRIYWKHDSNGQSADEDSQSMNSGVIDANFVYSDWLTVTLRGYYVFEASDNLNDYICSSFWPNAGGEIYATATFDAISFAGTLGLSYQEFQAILPFAEYWAASLYLYLRNGSADGLVDPASGHLVGGAGLGVFTF